LRCAAAKNVDGIFPPNVERRDIAGLGAARSQATNARAARVIISDRAQGTVDVDAR
jgi:hypothetical protein